MVVELEVPYKELEVGDSLIAWHFGPADSNALWGTFLTKDVIIERIDNEGVYWTRGSLGPNAYWYRILRTVPCVTRVPCAQCGRSLHPALTADKGFVHDCK